jgi:multicomponent Na+:H+ antiporter subunit D
MADIAAHLRADPAVYESSVIRTSFAFFTVGLAMKMALFPLHGWQPNAYAQAPSGASTFIAGTATKVSAYAAYRIGIGVFGLTFLLEAPLPYRDMLLVMACSAIVVGPLLAIRQTDLKRLLAYSSVAQIGYITLGLSLESITGLSAAIVHLFNHGITKAALFMLAGCAVVVVGGTQMERIAGLGRLMPLTSFGIVLAGLSLIGVPGTAGFISKWTLILACVERGQWWIVFAIVLSSLLAVAYVWRFVEAAYFREPPETPTGRPVAPLSMRIPAWIMTGAVVYFGLDSSLSLGTASAAASRLIGLQP